MLSLISIIEAEYIFKIHGDLQQINGVIEIMGRYSSLFEASANITKQSS